MPEIHAGKGVGENVSPALEWSAVPVSARQLLLVIEDIDVPMLKPLIHTVVLLPAEASSLSAGELADSNTAVLFVPAAFGRVGYAGPRPVVGHGPHRYVFRLYALDTVVPDARSLQIPELLERLAGHILASGHLIGTYERN